ncbi:MAG: transposase, partial [Bacilli bacterium]
IREVKTQEDEFDKLFYYNREILDDEMTLEEAKKEARDEALAEGRAEGLKEGRAEGLKEGKAEGVKQGKIDIAKAMLKENCVIELIAKVTDLSIKEIEKLKEELN